MTRFLRCLPPCARDRDAPVLLRPLYVELKLDSVGRDDTLPSLPPSEMLKADDAVLAIDDWIRDRDEWVRVGVCVPE